jgi:3-hydroxyisobutyrate dehydrogenase-like beta-hydroxyacid dehydrogenase
MQAAQGDCIGLIGIGLLGRAIASRLLTAGFSVLGFDLDAAKRQALAASGGTPAGSLADVAQHCATVVVAVFDTDQVEQVIERDAALAAGVVRTVICMSTCDPDRIAALAARVRARGIELLEVPISGTSAQVAQGEGVALIAGDAAAADAAARITAAICPRSYYLGAAGNGGRAKLAVNLILGLNRAAVAEGLAFAERLGLDRARLLDVAKGSAAYSQVMDVKGPLWAQDRFEPPLSRVDQSLKDFRLMCEMGRRVGQDLPFASLYAALMQDCIDHGEAARDNAILINAIRRRRAP